MPDVDRNWWAECLPTTLRGLAVSAVARREGDHGAPIGSEYRTQICGHQYPIARDIRQFWRSTATSLALRCCAKASPRISGLAIFGSGGGPTDDKPEVLAAPAPDPNILSIFLNLRVTDIRRYYDLWASRAQNSLRSLKSRQGNCGVTCATRMDTFIEVGQTTMTPAPLHL